MQLLRQPDAQPYEIACLPENPLRHLTHCLSFLCVLTKILCVKYAVTPLNGNAGCKACCNADNDRLLPPIIAYAHSCTSRLAAVSAAV